MTMTPCLLSFRLPGTRLRALLLLLLLSLGTGHWRAHAAPLLAGDFQTILEHRADELVIWKYTPRPGIYVLDFPNLTEQGRTFNRVTHLTEQFAEAYKAVLTEAQLEQRLHAMRRNMANMAFGHDVLVSELVLFFNLAERDKIPLFAEEQRLLTFLLDTGLVRKWRDIYQALEPGTVILSLPQIQARRDNEPQVSELARKAILMHELAHGEYYANPYYAEYCRRFWNDSLNDDLREKFARFLTKYSYSINEAELLVNEMQAYLMFTPDPLSFNASKLGVTQFELDAMREAFRRGRPPVTLPY